MHILLKVLNRFSKGSFLLVCLACLCSVSSMAQSLNPQDEHIEKPKVLNYTLGLRLRAEDINQDTHHFRLRPILGLSYGRWRLGIGDGQDWLRFNSFRKESGLSYQWLENKNIDLGLSLRVHNLQTGEAFDVFEAGKKTLRSRVLANVRLHHRWTAGLEWTQDLLNRGDSSTLSLGVSYAMPLSEHSEISVNSGATWAPAEHWKTAAGMRQADVTPLRAGIGSLGAGVSYKHSLAQRWAVFGSLALQKDVGSVANLPGPHSFVSGQMGILYFER